MDAELRELFGRAWGELMQHPLLATNRAGGSFVGSGGDKGMLSKNLRPVLYSAIRDAASGQKYPALRDVLRRGLFTDFTMEYLHPAVGVSRVLGDEYLRMLVREAQQHLSDAGVRRRPLSDWETAKWVTDAQRSSLGVIRTPRQQWEVTSSLASAGPRLGGGVVSLDGHLSARQASDVVSQDDDIIKRAEDRYNEIVQYWLRRGVGLDSAQWIAEKKLGLQRVGQGDGGTAQGVGAIGVASRAPLERRYGPEPWHVAKEIHRGPYDPAGSKYEGTPHGGSSLKWPIMTAEGIRASLGMAPEKYKTIESQREYWAKLAADSMERARLESAFRHRASLASTRWQSELEKALMDYRAKVDAAKTEAAASLLRAEMEAKQKREAEDLRYRASKERNEAYERVMTAIAKANEQRAAVDAITQLKKAAIEANTRLAIASKNGNHGEAALFERLRADALKGLLDKYIERYAEASPGIERERVLEDMRQYSKTLYDIFVSTIGRRGLGDMFSGVTESPEQAGGEVVDVFSR